MNNDNLKLWELVEKTDPSATKTVKLDGREQTTIGSYYMFKRATELFGAVGIGWGFDILEERYDKGAPLITKVAEVEQLCGHALTHTVKINFWYITDGKKGVIPAYGHTPAVYKSKYGITDDGEAPKKSLTDAIKKALSMLGFSADIFTGMFDDKDYVAQLQTEEQISKAENKEDEIEKRRTETIEYVQRHLEVIKSSKNAHEVKTLVKTCVRHLERQKLIASIRDICEKGVASIGREGEIKLKEIGETK